MHAALPEMYTADARFAEYFDRHGEHLSPYVAAAIRASWSLIDRHVLDEDIARRDAEQGGDLGVQIPHGGKLAVRGLGAPDLQRVDRAATRITREHDTVSTELERAHQIGREFVDLRKRPNRLGVVVEAKSVTPCDVSRHVDNGLADHQ